MKTTETQQNADQKIVQYLNEVHASEAALVRVLQSQIAMTPSGGYRDALSTHLGETKDHAARLRSRLDTLGEGGSLLQAGIGAVETVAGQALALAKTPLDLIRGSGGEEKVLKNAKDACATEALEIASYTALARLAKEVGDTQTERLATSILADERRMLETILKEIPQLTAKVFRADVKGDSSYDITKTGAADEVRDSAKAAKDATQDAADSIRDTAKDAADSVTKTAKQGSREVRDTAKTARKVPGVARAEGTVKGAVASADDLAIAAYDDRSADEITARLTELSQVDLAKVDAYERKNENRTTVTSRIDSLRGDEPWPGYDDLTVENVRSRLSEADDSTLKSVRTYERRHKNRTGVLTATERETSRA